MLLIDYHRFWDEPVVGGSGSDHHMFLNIYMLVCLLHYLLYMYAYLS